MNINNIKKQFPIFNNKVHNTYKLITKSNCVISGIRLSEILIEKFRSNLLIDKFFKRYILFRSL